MFNQARAEGLTLDELRAELLDELAARIDADSTQDKAGGQ